jgi:hypothetical protein
MVSLRGFLAICLTIALAGYQMAATPAHAHAYSGFHNAHVVSGHHHDGGSDHHGDHLADEVAQLDENGDPVGPASEQHESGFHSHAAPQFGAIDAATAMAVTFASHRVPFFDLDRLAALALDESPFKPPRTLL